MKRFRRSEHHQLERELRKRRPESRSDFVSALAGEVHRDTRRRTLVPRLALAGALAVAMLTVFAVFGGVGYTSSAVKSIDVSRLSQAVGHNGNNANSSNSASNNSQNNGNSVNASNAKHGDDEGDDDDAEHDQYKPGKGCGDKNHVHERENECKKPPK